MRLPLVTIIIPVYNGSNYIAEALKCAINQSYKNLEILVINDGSTDDGKTAKAVEPFLSDDRVKYIEKENGGVSSALNYGLKHMKGDFFSWLSHDDLIDADSVKKRYKFWVKNGSDPKTIISTNSDYIDKNGDTIFRVAAPSKNVNNIFDIISSTINGCSLLIHKDILANHKFREGMVFMQDYFLWATLINEGARIKLLKKKLTHNRIHDAQVSAKRFDLLIKDFGLFAKTFIDPLMEKQDYAQLKKICFTLEEHLSTRPFYKQFLDKYISFLKETKNWTKLDENRAKHKHFISWIVGKTRKKAVVPELDKEVKKVIFVTNLAVFHQTGLWDEYVNNNPDVDFTYLATEEMPEDRKAQHYEEEKRNYIIKSSNLDENELKDLFTDADIVVYGNCMDSRVENYITLAKHLVVESEHFSNRYKRGKLVDAIARWKFFNIDHKNWKKMDKYLLALSYYAADDYEKYGFKDRIYRFGYFPKIDYKEEERDPYKLLWYGRLIDWKKPDDALYALSQFKKADNKYTLDIVGEGPYEKKLHKLIKKMKLEDSVNIYPFEDNEKILDRVRKAGIVLFTSNRGEGWGVVLNEMLSQKSVVFANTNAGSTLYLADKTNSFIYDTRKTLKRKIRMYLNMGKDELNSVKEKAYDTIHNLWNNKVAAFRLGAFFSSIVKKECNFDKYESGPLSKHKKITKKLISDETNIAKIEKKSKKNITLGAIFGYATVALAVISGLVLIPMITNEVGKDMYGIYGLATSLISLFMVDLGLTATTNTYLAKLRAQNDKNAVEKFLATIFKIYLLLDLIFMAVIAIIYLLVDKIYIGYTPEQRAILKPILLIVGGYSLINFPSNAFTGALSAYEKFGWVKFCEFTNKLLYLVFSIVAVKVGWGIYGLVIVNAIAGIISVIMRFLYMRFHMGIRLRLFAKVDKNTVKEIFKFSSWALILAICARLIFNITPSILGIVCIGDGAEQCAIFAIITTIEGYIYILGSTMSSFFMAKIARAEEESAEEKRKHLQEMAQKIGKLQFFIIALIVLGYITVGQEFLTIWLNDANFANPIYLGIILLCISEFVAIPEVIFDQAMYSEGHVKPLAINAIIKAVINLALSFWLSSQYGALGACIAIACSRVVNVIMNNISYHKYLDVSLSKYFRTIYIRGAITTIISLGFGLILHFFVPIYDYRIKLIVCGCAFVLVYLICTFFITFTIEERYTYLNMLMKIFKKNIVKNPREAGQKIKVLQFVGYMNGGGVESYVMSYFRELHDKFDYTFVIFEGSTIVPKEEIESLGGKIVVVPNLKHYIKFKKEFKKILKSGDYDIIHSHINTLSVFPLKLAVKCQIKVRIAHSHSTSSRKEVLRNIVKNILKMFSKSYATDYFACSLQAAKFQFGKSAVKHHEVKILPNAIDLEKFAYNEIARNEIRTDLNVKKDDILVGNFGRLVVTKNQKYILEIAENTAKNNTNLKYLIVGSGELENELKENIERKNLSNVILLDNKQNINEYYSAIDVFVLPSLYEGLGLTAVEAEANGLYCVLSTKVPKETLITKYGKYLPTKKKSVNHWVNEVSEKHARKKFIKTLQDAKYDIHVSAVELEKIYKKLA